MADSRWSKYLATGVAVDPGEPVPIRQDFREFAKEPKNLYLYFEGLKEFQAVDKDDPLSYYQIAGIHGRPYQTWPAQNWNRDIKQKYTKQSKFGGFCTHSSILFLTWHRPYLALFESALYTHVQNVARKFNGPDKQTYQALAKRFRIPFWDWARRDTQVVPKQALDATYGKNPNPLFNYQFPENTTGDITWESQSTYRSPKFLQKIEDFYRNPKLSGKDIPIVIPENNLTERTAWVLQAYATFPAMSNNRLRQGKDGIVEDRSNWGSLEDIHNAIHGLTGGHMGDPEVSAFDPIFWLHHTNIDRLFALWQGIHENEREPNTFVIPRPAGDGGFSTQGTDSERNVIGDEESITYPLYPFRPDIKSKDSWYTSKMTGDTRSFGYTYPETATLNYPTTEDDKTKLLADIGAKYHSLPMFIQQSKRKIPTAGQELLAGANFAEQIAAQKVPATADSIKTLVENLPDSKSLLETSLEPSKPFIHKLAPDNKYLEWLTNIKAEKHTLEGDYTVHIFLGPADDEPNVALWPVAPTHVGTFSPFGQSRDTSCAKCQVEQTAHTEITGQIPLTLALVERYLAGIIEDLTENSVIPYLTENLHWRVAKGGDTKVDDQSQVGGLKVLVVSNEVTVPDDESQLPIYAPDVKAYPEITTKPDGTGRGNGTGLT